MKDETSTTIVWLRRDLRLADNPALAAACERGRPVVPLALWPQTSGATPPGTPGGASRWWLARSLAVLDAGLRRRGSWLEVRRSPPDRAAAVAALVAAAGELGAHRVIWARGIDPHQLAEDDAVRRALESAGVEPSVVPSANLLVGPDAVHTGQGGPYQVFTPFWRAVSAGLTPPAPLPAPATVPAPTPAAPRVETSPAAPETLAPATSGGAPLVDLQREAVEPWSIGFAEAWQPGEAGARARLARLLDRVLPGYADDRDRPDLEGSSRLSPHLHWGELSARQVWHAVAGRLSEAGLEAEAAIGPPSSRDGARAASPNGADATTPGAGLTRGAAAFLRQLGWREFAHHLLWHFPETVASPLRPQFAAFPWRDDPDAVVAWQRGRTGFPFVDAAMRCLWTTGWMHNRARLVAGSFLVKDLLLPWQAGAAWFWDTLVDADLANNTLGWQWVAGCGADAAPYFRIFNPVAQGRRFDPDGSFVRRWVPELASLPAGWLHEPWAAPADVLATAGVRLGATYPVPIVDHGEARSRALAAYAVVKLAR